ncbi:biotin/lipoate--protein ligase family protein [Tepidamorphus sp. 3E244]|uniref:biotin/lipoate--protein ligase family protein n=1 Tax=Tepidamorphus sp. 3E244 TaxID=3385498 RepID=UPI0038FCD20C
MSDYPTYAPPSAAEPAAETVEQAPSPLGEPEFPPLLTGHEIGADEDAFVRATEGARAGRLEAGDFLWKRTRDAFDTAIVLEPDVPRARAAEFAFVAQVAFADSFGAISPPEVALTFGWPNALRLNGGRIGHLRLAISPEDDADGAPLWMVAGLSLVVRHERYDVEPGNMPDITTFEEEGCGDVDTIELISSFARHLLVWIHTWSEDGFAAVHETYLFRADGHKEDTELESGGQSASGTFMGLDENGGALIKRADGSMVALPALPGLLAEPGIGTRS